MCLLGELYIFLACKLQKKLLAFHQKSEFAGKSVKMKLQLAKKISFRQVSIKISKLDIFII